LRDVLASLWHNQMGHAPTECLKIAVPDVKTFVKNQCCKACMKGQMTHLKFNQNFDATSQPLEVVHRELVGPILPSSNGGGRYFLTLVNQYTGFINVTILKEKSDTVTAIKNSRLSLRRKLGSC
jgi:hypothetical protein